MPLTPRPPHASARQLCRSLLLVGMLVAAPALARLPSYTPSPSLAEGLAAPAFASGFTNPGWVSAGSGATSSQRVLAELGGALLLGAATLPMVLDAPAIGVPVGILGVMLGTYLGGVLTGGEGTFLGTLLGGSIGSAAGILLALSGAGPALLLLGPFVGSIVGYELSHAANDGWAARTRTARRDPAGAPALPVWKAAF